MKGLTVKDLQKHANAEGRVADGKTFTLQRVRRFQEADQRLQEACARLGIEKPNMVS